MNKTLWLAAAGLSLAASGCGMESSAASSMAASADSTGAYPGGADYSYDDTSAESDSSMSPGPEQESSASLPPPVGGDHKVFIPSATLDAVVRIDATTLGIDLIEVGIDPTAIRGYRSSAGFGVVVTNTGSEDVSVVPAAESDAIPSTITLDAGTAVNQLEISPDGTAAIAWYTPEPNAAVDVGSLQEVRAIVLAPGKEAIYPVGVGFRPLSVSFGQGDDHAAYVVTERGVSRVALDNLAGATFAPPVAVSPDPLESASDREVLVANGETAVVRRGGVNEIRLVDLKTAAPTIVATDTAPTDIDLSPDGKEVVAVLRDEAAVLRVPLADPTAVVRLDLGGLPAGQVTLTPDGKWAALYTSIASTETPNEWVIVLDLAAGTTRTVPLEKSVRAVEPSPDGKRLVVLHQPTLNYGAGLGAIVDRSQGYSVVDVASGYAKLELLESAPLGVVVTADSKRGFVLVPAGIATAQNAVVDIDLLGLSTKVVPLGSPPVHAVAVGGRLAVSQDHASGRVTFIDLITDATETVTGFQLNGLIR